VGCTIEDATGKPGESLYDFQLSVERIAAATEAARKLPFPFVLTARAHNFLYPDPSLDDTIARLQAYEKVGADVLFAPALPDMASVALVCSALSKPVNFMAGLPGKSFPVSQLAEVGVKRISLAAALYRTSMTAMFRAAREVQETGTFGFVENSKSSKELSTLIRA
jgi:2-methylisocitrate lyase-like PEP mutase family enzyme